MHIELNHQSHGEGPPLLILHGLFGSLTNWSFMHKYLGNHLTMYCLDLRNHGDSPHSSQFDLRVMVEDLRFFMEDVKIQQGIVLGHSLGGKIAMTFADRYPEKVTKLIVVDIAPRSYPKSTESIIRSLIDLDLTGIASLKQASEALEQAIPSEPERLFLIKNLIRTDDGKYHWRINLQAILDNHSELKKGPGIRKPFLGPVLFMRGEHSEFIKPDDYALIKRYYPNAEITTIQGAGHWLQSDAPELTAKAILDFSVNATDLDLAEE